jgi:phytanoyl-CoA hydroxylase
MTRTANQTVAQPTTALEREVPVDDHPAGLYSNSRVAQTVPDLAGIRDQEIGFFRDHGYLAVKRGFSPEAVQAAAAAVDDLIDGKRADFRGIQFEGGLGDKANLTRQQRRIGVRKLMSFTDYDDRLKVLATDPALLNTLERLLGASPALFQEMALLKPPRIGREKPWHQDCAYFNIPHDTPVVGVWIALDQATAQNGALHVIPGSHHKGPAEHFKRRDWQICDTEIDVASDVVVPLDPGGVLLWHGLTHHGSPPNGTEFGRRALQFHYRPHEVRETSVEQRMEIFGGDVRGAQC